jgi:hypothetical protein
MATITEPRSAMNKTLYVKDEDGPIWDKARELTGDKLSQFIIEKLRAFVWDHQGKQQGFQRIAIQYLDKGIPRAKAFTGRWLISPQQPWEGDVDLETGSTDKYAVAVTAKNNVVVFNFGDLLEDGQFSWGIFNVHESFEEANRDRPWGLIAEAMRRMGIEVQELDI